MLAAFSHKIASSHTQSRLSFIHTVRQNPCGSAGPMHFYSPEGEKIRNIKQLKNRTMHIFISMTSDLIIIDQTSFPHERATVIDYFPLHKTPVAANPSLSSLAHTWLHRPNRHKINIILYTEHKNKMCRACTSTLHKKKIWGCLNSTCYTIISV